MTMDIAWLVTLLLEHSHCYSQGKAGYLLDREKCFDRLPWSITFQLEREAGYPELWSKADQRLNQPSSVLLSGSVHWLAPSGHAPTRSDKGLLVL